MSDGVNGIRAERFWEDLHFGPDGLVTVVVQSLEDGRVLMVAHADREACRRTAVERRAWFWSRSRQQLWRKGETSGHALDVAEVRWDCDADALLYLVRAHGPACHTGEVSCFFRGEADATTPAPGAQPAAPAAGESLGAVLDRVAAVVAARRQDMPPGSYVADLLRAGPQRALQKVGEEAVEAVIAGCALAGAPTEGSQAQAVGEFADLLFHVLTALAALELPPAALARELAARHRLRPPRG